MGEFNLADYETVEERLKRFYRAYPDGRIITENLTQQSDRMLSTWVVRATVYLGEEDQFLGLPKATGLAFEVDGVGMTQKTAALETCETSAIGRALANMDMSGNKRASREEMEKVGRPDSHAINQVKVRIARHMQGKTPEEMRAAISEATNLPPDEYTVEALTSFLRDLERAEKDRNNVTPINRGGPNDAA